MKKTRLILCLICILSATLLSACGGYQTTANISAHDLISEENFSSDIIALRGDHGGSFTSFLYSKPLDKLADKVLKHADDAENTEMSVYQDSYVLFNVKKDNENLFFLLARVPNVDGDGEKTRYALFTPTASFSNVERYIYFPYHLIENADIQLYPGQSVIPSGASFKTAADITEFEEFYRSLKYCEVVRDGNVIKVKNKRDDQWLQLKFESEQKGSYVQLT